MARFVLNTEVAWELYRAFAKKGGASAPPFFGFKAEPAYESATSPLTGIALMGVRPARPALLLRRQSHSRDQRESREGSLNSAATGR